jgi:hypothetical protein
MLALNVEILLEKLLARVILFWERRVVVTIATANLVAHRLRNRKTMVGGPTTPGCPLLTAAQNK